MIVRESTRAIKMYGDESAKPGYSRTSFRAKAPEHIDRDVIAWDMEGISLSGQDKPQHPVLFGCSAEVDSPLIGERLGVREMLEYIIKVGAEHPYAIHVGFAFKYDANMIIHGLTEPQILRLWKTGTVRFRFDLLWTWSLKWVPGKFLTVSKRPAGKRSNTRGKTSVTIYDFSTFFGGQSFIKAAEQILRDEISEDDRDVIAHGKSARGNQTWDDMPDIEHYWAREIVLIKRVFEKFRDVMYRAGFALKDWYGPGALANYINATRGIRGHLGAAQTTDGDMPDAVHQASKVAFSGGRFELFHTGRIQGPIYAIDINSAYPFALTHVPSMAPDNGQWIHVTSPKRIALFGVYRVRFVAPNASPLEHRPMPLFWRDNRGMISYPAMAHGWYWSPEAAMVLGMPGAEVIEGWEWAHKSDERPWAFLQEMFDTRIRLGKENLLSMPFKLGPNSLYGKYAQTVGWDKEKKSPPKSHALPVAGWVTSFCRAMLYRAMMHAPDKIVAVETDAIYSLVPPDQLGVTPGDGLGQWGYEVYDEMMYIQSGMYHYKKNGEWKGVRSRGIARAEYPVETAKIYLQSLKANESWMPMTLTTRPRFIGAGAAFASSKPFKEIHTSWVPQEKTMVLGDTGKRTHIAKACPQCREGQSPWDASHRLLIRSRSDGERMSYPRALPWENAHPQAVQDMRDAIELEKELISR